jgi:hypothetical protein
VRLDQQACRDRMTAARVGYLATVGADRQPHIVPVTFAVVDDRIVTSIDHKPKSTTKLRRLRNIAENPAVAVLCDNYDDDKTIRERAVSALVAKYPQYDDNPPNGPVLVVTIKSWTGWQYGDEAGFGGRPP